jgi:hypothetical protein
VKSSLYNNVLAVQSLTAANRTNGTVNGTAVNLWSHTVGRQQFRSAMVLIQTGTVTDGTHTITVQESDDNSSFTPVADGDLQGSEPAIVSTNDNVIFEVGYHGTQQYLRVSVVTTGATTGGTLGAVILLGDARRRPVAHS